MTELARHFTQLAWQAVGGATNAPDEVVFTGLGGLPSVFPVTDLASAAVAAAGLSIAELVRQAGGRRQDTGSRRPCESQPRYPRAGSAGQTMIGVWGSPTAR